MRRGVYSGQDDQRVQTLWLDWNTPRPTASGLSGHLSYSYIPSPFEITCTPRIEFYMCPESLLDVTFNTQCKSLGAQVRCNSLGTNS